MVGDRAKQIGPALDKTGPAQRLGDKVSP